MRARLPIIPGQRFGAWTVLAQAENYRTARPALCRCDCGREAPIVVNKLYAGTSKSCGCFTRARLGADNLRHGARSRKATTPEYRTWLNMRQRVNNPRNEFYADYGGRGIKVCARWGSFENFLADMGTKPSRRHSIERRNNSGDYEPGNCSWEIMSTQARNTRRNIIVSFGGRDIPLVQALEELGHPTCGRFYHTVKDRIRKLGWAPDVALTTPVRERAKAEGRAR